jgi:hypothetical protein
MPMPHIRRNTPAVRQEVAQPPEACANSVERVRQVNATRWDAQTAADIGLLITSYLDRNPAPADSLFADDLEDWGQRLRSDGQVRLRALGTVSTA